MTAAAIEVAAPFTLRCHRCSHAIGTVPGPMRVVAMFKASITARLEVHRDEVRRRCNSCGWVHVFYPPELRGRIIETKSGPIERAGLNRPGPSTATHSPQRRSGHA